MKKFLVGICLGFFCMNVNAQLMRAPELEKYAVEKYGDKWTKAAETIGANVLLDKNNSMTFSEVIDCGNQTKSQLYVIINYWFTQSFNDANAVVKLNDKELGCIIGQGFVGGVAEHTGGMNHYSVNLRPTIKVDIKDGKVRVTYTLQGFYVSKLAGGGIMGALSGTRAVKEEEVWVLEECFPYAKKDSHKKSSAKALVMANAYSNVIMDKIKEAVQHGIAGNENDNW